MAGHAALIYVIETGQGFAGVGWKVEPGAGRLNRIGIG
jgi:hypothetical protein